MVTNQSLKVNDGGLILKSSGSAMATDSTGNPVDITLAEIQDDIVNLVYADNIKFSDFSNKKTFGSSESLYAREKGRSIGDEINFVQYNENATPVSAKVIINRNAGIDDALTEDLVEFDLIPAHALLNTPTTNDLSSYIDVYKITNIAPDGYTIKFDTISVRRPFGYATKNPITGMWRNSVEDNSPWFGEILNKKDNSNYKVWVDVVIGTKPQCSGRAEINETYLDSDGKSYRMVRVNDGGVLFNVVGSVDIEQYSITDGELIPCAYISSLSWLPPLSTNLDVDELGLLEIWGSPSQKKKDVFKRRGYTTKKQLKSNLAKLAKPLNQYGIDVIAIPYEEDLQEITESDANADPGPWITKEIDMDENGVKNTKYFYDKNYSYLHRAYQKENQQENTKISTPYDLMGGSFISADVREAKVYDAIRASKQFKESQKKYDNLLDLNSSDITPFNTSLREILVAKYSPSTNLLDDLKEIYDELLNVSENHDIFSDETNLIMPSEIFTPSDYSNIISLIWDNRVGDTISKLEASIHKMNSGSDSLSSSGMSLIAMNVASDIDHVLAKLKQWYHKAKKYEYYVGESITGNGKSIGFNNEEVDKTPAIIDRGYYSILPRYLVPVDYGTKKVKYRKKNWLGKVEVSTKKKDLGIRWVELRFVNAFVYNLHRKSEQITGIQVPDVLTATNALNWRLKSIKYDAHVNTNIISGMAKLLSSDITATMTLAMPQQDVGVGKTLYFEIYDSANADKSKFAGMWSGVVLSDVDISFNVPGIFYLTNDTSSLATLSIRRIIKSYPETQPNPNPINCQIEYKIPYLPSENDIRDYVFHSYGSIDQSEYAARWNDFKKMNAAGIGHGSKHSFSELSDLLADFELKHKVNPGFEVFKPTSTDISEMAASIQIHQKASFLLSVLIDAFGASRVKLIETVRSYDDQEILQMGGPSSNFLSWHNYGMSIKINIYEPNALTTIRDGSKDFFRLAKIAESFTEAAKKGYFGDPCNVVWCGRLTCGSNIFVWEFLPLGIGHKDAIKFRTSMYNQIDPIESIVPIDVDSAGYVVSSPIINRISVPSTEGELDSAIYNMLSSLNEKTLNDEVLDIIEDAKLIMSIGYTMAESIRIKEKQSIYRQLVKWTTDQPIYVSKTSKAYLNAYIESDKHYISPKDITNYPLHKNLVMKDIQEYFFLIMNKFKANGSGLCSDQRIIDWKMTNPISFKQMIVFYSLIGSFGVTQSLLASDYSSRFESMISMANQNPVQFVRDFLGIQEYMNIKIYPDGLERDSGYITLHDGRISIAIMQCRSIHPEGYRNMFGEKQASFLTIEFGQVKDGTFVPEYEKDESGNVIKNELELIKSSAPVLSGFAPDGTIIGPKGYMLPNGEKINMGDAYMLHVLIKDKLLDELKQIQSMFDGLKTEFLHDNFENSPNKRQILENEFGAIASQDLMSFDELMDVYRKIDINSKNDTNSVGDKQGIGNTINSDSIDDLNRDQSVYEKLVSTTQFTGIHFSRNTKEKPTIEPVINSKLETVLKRMIGDKSPDVRDIL